MARLWDLVYTLTHKDMERLGNLVYKLTPKDMEQLGNLVSLWYVYDAADGVHMSQVALHQSIKLWIVHPAHRHQ